MNDEQSEFDFILQRLRYSGTPKLQILLKSGFCCGYADTLYLWKRREDGQLMATKGDRTVPVNTLDQLLLLLAILQERGIFSNRVLEMGDTAGRIMFGDME